MNLTYIKNKKNVSYKFILSFIILWLLVLTAYIILHKESNKIQLPSLSNISISKPIQQILLYEGKLFILSNPINNEQEITIIDSMGIKKIEVTITD